MSSRHQRRVTPSSVQGSVARSRGRSQRCTGCPGCSEPPRQLSALPALDLPSHGESKVRAWLEDARQRDLQDNAKTFARNLEYLRELARRSDLAEPDGASMTGRSVSSWKENPPMLRTFRNIARSEILENGGDDRHSVSKRSTKSMFEETEYDRYAHGKREGAYRFAGDDAINARVRMAIESCFVKQMEESATVKKERCERVAVNNRPDGSEDEKRAERPPVAANSNVLPERPSQTSHGDSAPRRLRKPRAPCAPLPKKELPDMINELPGAKNTAKRIMDAVIREMVDAKALEHHPHHADRPAALVNDYEVDSLERTKTSSRKSSTSPESSTDHSSPALSSALPMDEELTMQNAVINTRTGEITMSKLNNRILLERNNYYNSLPELITQRSEAYSLVSEVYVNDGYASPACSDDSGPEIRYEPENPGHLTIKVQDSPENYVKLDESEYEPDTLDRKPMKLRINEDVRYEREIANEIYVDSLERPAQILLRSKGSFRDDDSVTPQPRGSLREIYEAKIRSQLKESQQRPMTNGECRANGDCRANGEAVEENTLSWKRCRYLTPDSRQAKRQRQPHNRPDVVPPPLTEEIYQRPKPPRRVEDAKRPPSPAKNVWGRSAVEAGDPTASNGAPVPKDGCHYVGNESCLCETRIEIEGPENGYGGFYAGVDAKVDLSSRGSTTTREKRAVAACPSHRYAVGGSKTRSTTWSDGVGRRREDANRTIVAVDSTNGQVGGTQNCSQSTKGLARGCGSASESTLTAALTANNRRRQGRGAKVDDSGYLSSTDSNGSRKRLLRHEVSSVSETDETESVCDGASESGAESIGTDSVFFGNFRRQLPSEAAKSADSGVDFGTRSSYRRHALPYGAENGEISSGVPERTNLSASDSETESLVTVLPPCNRGQRSSLVA